ncbi:MAG: hypothetical protein WCG85_27280, partial [Polyangia bacterium]
MRHTIFLATTLLFSSCGGGTGLVGSSEVDGSSTMDGTTSTDGTKAPGGAMATTCSALPVDPSIAFQETCSSFIPPLGNEEVVFVGQTTSGPPGNQVVAHRF